MSAPALEPTGFRQPRLGWLLLFLIVTFLVSTQLMGYLERGTSPDAGARTAETQLRTFMMQRAYTERIEQFAGRKLDTPKPDPKPLRELLPEIKRSEAAAAIALAMARESGQDPPATAVQKLENSDKDRLQALLRVYSSDTLTREEARALLARMPDRPFVYVAAKVHALEKAGEEGVLRRYFPKAILFPIVVMVGVLAFLAGTCLWFAYAVARKSGNLKPLGHPTGALTPDNADRYAMRTSQILLVFLLLSIVFSQLAVGRENKIFVIVQSALLLAVVLFLAKIPIYGKRISPRLQGLHTEHLGKNILWGVAGALANIPVLAVMLLIATPLMRGLPAPEHPATTELQQVQNLLTVLSTFFAASIVAPIMEEICFRGTLLPALASVMRSVPGAIVLSSLIFAAIHPTGVPAWPMLGAIGATAAMLTYQTKSLVPAMVMHAVHNSMTLLLLLSIF